MNFPGGASGKLWALVWVTISLPTNILYFLPNTASSSSDRSFSLNPQMIHANLKNVR